MYSKSKEKSEEIKKLFEEGASLTEMCEKTSSSQLTIKKVLCSFNIDYDEFKKQDYQRRLDLVPVLYSEGKPQLYIEQTLKLTRKTIRGILKNNPNVKYKTKSEQWLVSYNSTLAENCFDELTPESIYWIGLLYADGHIEKDRGFSIELTLHSNDMSHLELFKKFLNSDRKITKGNSECHRVRINSEKIHKRLLELGFKHDKSYTAIPHPLLKNSRDFWRGVVDGDGGVYNYPATFQIHLCGTLETIFEFIIFCSKFVKTKDKYPTKCKKSKSLYEVSYYGQDVVKISNLLYKDSTTYLERKYQKYLEILKTNKNQ